VLFSDGVADASDELGARFGEDRILDIVDAHRHSPTASIVESVAAAVSEFAGAPTDDRTILVLRA
jgi:serine phosphatase RsbU (regulator of sigma subunit)